MQKYSSSYRSFEINKVLSDCSHCTVHTRGDKLECSMIRSTRPISLTLLAGLSTFLFHLVLKSEALSSLLSGRRPALPPPPPRNAAALFERRCWISWKREAERTAGEARNVQNERTHSLKRGSTHPKLYGMCTFPTFPLHALTFQFV